MKEKIKNIIHGIINNGGIIMKNKIQKIFSTLLALLMIAGCGNLTVSSSETHDHSSHNHSSNIEHSSSDNNHNLNTNKEDS